MYETTDFITDAEQGDMNVDAGSGKSVNAIRSFSGKGILVLISDLMDKNGYESALRFLLAQDLDVYVIHAREFCTRRGMNYLMTSTQTPVDQLVSSYLRQRGLVK